MIPNKNHKEDLKNCIDSIRIKSTYTNYEIIVVENNSTQEDIFEYYKELEEAENIKVVTYEGEFNYSKINNTGVKQAKGEYLILLNNDIKIITKNWIEEMLMHAQREEVGGVGAKLWELIEVQDILTMVCQEKVWGIWEDYATLRMLLQLPEPALW